MERFGAEPCNSTICKVKQVLSTRRLTDYRSALYGAAVDCVAAAAVAMMVQFDGWCSGDGTDRMTFPP